MKQYLFLISEKNSASIYAKLKTGIILRNGTNYSITISYHCVLNTNKPVILNYSCLV